MKSVFALFLLLCISIPSFAQNNPNFSSFKDGIIKGVVKAEKNKEAIEYASVSVFRVRDTSLVTGIITDTKGNFIMNQVSMGRFFLRISFVGFESFTSEAFMISPRSPEYNVGIVLLKSGAHNLNEVQIVDEKPLVEFTLDKKIINVEKDITVVGGNAKDVLKNDPSVNVDMDGKVQLRGSGNITVLIDGRMTGLSTSDPSALLDQIPSSTIKEVEIMTNPSSRFDAEGNAGIINIVLKKEKEAGINGTVNFNIGTTDKYSGTLNLGWRSNKLSTYLNIDARSQWGIGGMETERTTFLADTSILKQLGKNRSLHKGLTIRPGLEYQINANNTIMTSFMLSTFEMKRKEKADNQYFNNEGITDEYYEQNNSSVNDHSNFDIQLGHKLSLPNSKSELNSDISFNTSSSEEDKILDQFYSIYDQQTQSFIESQKSFNKSDNYNFNIKSDFTKNISTEIKLESGIKFGVQDNNNPYTYSDFDSSSSSYLLNSNLSNEFNYAESVGAAYLSLSNTSILKSKFGYKIGIRAEHTSTEVKQVTLDSTYTNDYLDFFPSAFVSYKIKQGMDLQTSYSRRISRPRGRQLNPFPDASDPLNIRTGNPYLLPEYVNNFELNFIRILSKVNYQVGMFYKHIDNASTRFRSIDSSGVTTTTFANLGEEQSYGLESSFGYRPGKWLMMNLSVSVYNSIIDDANNVGEQKENISFNTRFNSMIQLPKDFSLQISGFYRGKNETQQGFIKPMYFADIGIQKSFRKDKIILAFKVQDLFDSRQFRLESNGRGFTSDNTFYRDERNFALNITYKINEGLKGRDRRRMQEGGDDSMPDMGF
ncbi:MAG TPA: outer membrane beta-barrel family protein [Bacteroidia bacterium]|nr:outer membrane beta-barrel family protein [Bacteroidia bacterium]HNT80574.1 outer membrane beta-barrel family protein [Bacteroidia bacterium]